MLDTLEELGYLGRARAVDSDERQVYVSLTPAGERALQASDAVYLDRVRASLSGLTETETATLERLLRKLQETDQSSWLRVLPLWAVKAEEIAHFTASLVLLEDEHQVSLLKCVKPLIPGDLLQVPPTEAREIEAQHAQLISMFRAWHGGGWSLALLRPVFDDLG